MRGRTGDTNSTSIVPSSFSRVMATEVIIAEISIRMITMTPGTKRNTLRISGL